MVHFLIRKIVWHTFVKLYSPSYVDRGDSLLLSIVIQNTAVKPVSVDRDSRFCSNLMQNDDLPDPLGPLKMHVEI